MAEESGNAPDLQQLQSLVELREQPFRSDVPVIGRLIVWFRSAWNSVSTKWYVRPMIAQQTQYNQAVLDMLSQMDARGRELDLLVDDLDRRVMAQDHEQVQLTHDLGEATARIAQLQAMIQSLADEPPPSGER